MKKPLRRTLHLLALSCYLGVTIGVLTGCGGSAATPTPSPMPTVRVAASPTTVTAGGSATLTWTSANAESASINNGIGTVTLNGTTTVAPTQTTTYAITVSGSGAATATAQATVTVTAPGTPTVTISASPTSINAGQSSTLTVTATNSNQVVITNNVDSTTYTLSATGGTQTVRPTATSIYTATVTGANSQTATATVTVTAPGTPTVTISASPTSINAGQSSTLTVTATNSNQVVITNNVDSTTYTLSATGGTQTVRPTATSIYTATVTGANSQTATATATVTVGSGSGSVTTSVNHIIFMMQENRSFDSYFGMLNPYRKAQGWNVGDDGKDYEVDGIDDKLATITNVDDEGDIFHLFKFRSSCIDDESSAWLESYGDVSRYDFLPTRPIMMDGFVHTAEGFAKSCAASGTCSGNFTDLTGRRAMGYYDQDYLNYYYYMASQFALSDRWFSPVSSKSISNRIATFTGGTTQGLVHDPANDDHLPQLNILSIFEELDQAKVSWKVYYTVTNDLCLADDECSASAGANYPATTFAYLSYSYQFLYENPTGAPCTGTTQGSSVVGDSTNSFCIDLNHVAPLSHFFTDLTNTTLPSFAFIEAGYGNNDEHPGSGQSILSGQVQVANILNSFMASPSWKDSVFFLSYDEGGGPYDHVPPVAGHSNDYTAAALGTIPDISQIAVNADSHFACMPSGGVPTLHCDLNSLDPGANPADAPAVQGFAAQLGFRLPNLIVSPFVRRHYVSHTPMDHTAVIKFVENRFIGSSAHLTPRDATQPDLLEFFDFNNVPWATPPAPPNPVTPASLGHNPCDPTNLGS